MAGYDPRTWALHAGLLSTSAHSITRPCCLSRFEQAYVSSLIYGWDGEYFWTALQDINETGAFRWLSGDEVMYTHWNRDQPGKEVAMGGMGTSPPCRVGAGCAAWHGPTLRQASPRSRERSRLQQGWLRGPGHRQLHGAVGGEELQHLQGQVHLPAEPGHPGEP